MEKNEGGEAFLSRSSASFDERLETKTIPRVIKYPFFFGRFPKKKGRKKEIEKTFLYVSYVRVSRVSGKHSFFFPFQPEGKLYDRA